MPKEKILIFLSFLTTFIFLFSFIAYAWQEPTSNPPGGDVYAPINTGSDAQTKAGDLTVGGHLTAGGLTVNDNFTASIGCADFLIGYSGRRGSPGRAIVDLGNDLRFNYGGDWPKASIGSDLDIYGDITSVGAICLDDGCKSRWDQVTGTNYWTRSADNTKLYPNNTGWNVGIGTTNPGEKLHVEGGAIKLHNPQGYPYGINIDHNFTGGWAREFKFSYGGSGTMFALGAYGSGSSLTYGYIGGNSTASTAHGSPWMVFKPNGNVGIGTTSPSQKLDVRGNIVIRKGYYSQLHIISDDYWAGIEIRTQSASEGHPHIDFTNNHSSNYGVRIYAPNDNKLTITGGDLEVNKITVNQIDPVYKIKDKKYVTYMPDMIGQKLEVVGEGKTQNGIFEVDLAKQKEGSDLWLFYNVVKEKTIIPFVSSQSDASLYAYINGSKFIVKVREGNKNAKFSYRLIGTRKDYQKTDNLLKEDASIYIDIDALEK